MSRGDDGGPDGRWFGSRGSNAVFTCHILAITTSMQVTIRFWTKKTSESDDAATFLGLLSSSGVGLATCAVSGCKDVVSYISAAVDEGGLGDQWVHFAMLTPTWSDA